MQALNTASESYKTDNGSLPKNLDNHGLYVALSGMNSGKVYMSFKSSQVNDNGEIVDAWGTPIQISVAEGALLMRSAGNDRIFGTQDDITSQ